MELIRRRRGLIRRTDDITPLYHFKNVEFTSSGTSTGLVLFEEDKDITILSEFVYYSARSTGSNIWQVSGAWQCSHYADYFNNYFCGVRYFKYYSSTYPHIGTIFRVYQRYSSAEKRVRQKQSGYAGAANTASSFRASSDELIIARGQNGGATLRSLDIYDIALSDRFLDDWIANTPTLEDG